MKRFSLCLLSVAGAGTLALSAAWGAERPADAIKREVEARPKAVVAERSAPAEEANPTVAPGQVNWHPTFAAACEASKKSGKPVLLFQLLGKLDQKFC